MRLKAYDIVYTSNMYMWRKVIFCTRKNYLSKKKIQRARPIHAKPTDRPIENFPIIAREGKFRRVAMYTSGNV